MNNITEVLERLQHLVDTSKQIPFTGAIRIDKSEIEEILYDLNISIPDTVKEAEDIIIESNAYVDSAKSDAKAILEQAQMEANRLVSEHEVYIRAVDLAEQQAEAANIELEKAVSDAIVSIDNVLANISQKVEILNERLNADYNSLNQSIGQSIEEIYQMRKELRG